MTKTNSLTLAAALAVLGSLSTQAQNIAYDNTSNYQGSVSARGAIEIGDEITLTSGPNSLITSFQFEYNYTGSSPLTTGVLRIYDHTGGGGLAPGNLLFQSSAFTLQNGFHSGTVANMSVVTPTAGIFWTVDFSGADIDASLASAGLLFYNGVPQNDLPGGSEDEYWENHGSLASPNWQIATTASLVDNFGARVTAVPEPSTIALAIGGAALVGMSLRRRKS